MNTSRWVSPALSELKREADEAGARFREARKRCFRSNVQYYFHRELLKIKPLRIFAPPPEQLARLNLDTVEQLRDFDAERQAARVALDSAKLNLDKAVTRYREAKSLRTEEHEG